MSTPRGVAVNQTTGNVYAVDGVNNRVVVFDSKGTFLRAFGADVVAYGPDQANEVQAVDLNATSGNFTLTFNGQTTAALAATATATEVQSALNALTSIGGLSPAGAVTVTGGPGNAGGTSPYKITFGGSLAATNVNQITGANVSLSGGVPATAITAATVNEGEVGFEICVPTAGDFCKAGNTGAAGGSLNTPQGIGVNQATGDVYVTDQNNLRVQQFDASGNFIRAFGQDVVSTGFPDNSVAASAVQTLTVPGTVTGGTFKLSFGGQTTGWTASGTLTCDGVSTTVTAVSNFAGLSLGEEISSSPATCIQPGTKVSAFNSGAGTITLSQPTENNVNSGVAALSANLPYNVSATNLKEALEKLSTIGAANVAVGGGPGATNPLTITFAGALANNPEPLIGVNSSGLTGGTATIANTTTGATGFEICSAASTDVCKVGVSASTGGAFKSTFNGYPVVAPIGAANAGDVLVADPANQRVQEFSSAGAFVRAFGLNVVNAGPDNNGTTNFEVCSLAAGDSCQIGTAGTGNGAFGANTPTRVAEDASSNLYTVETAANFRIQKFVLPAASSVAITASGPFDTTDLTGISTATAPTDVAVNPTASANVLVTKGFAAAATPSCPITGASSIAESRVIEVSSTGTLEGTHGTCAGLPVSNERGLASRQSTGDLYATSTLTASRIYLLNTGQPAAPAASITNVSGVGAHAATISAFVNPNGPESTYGQETTYKFEYKRSADPNYTLLGSGEASAGNRTTNKLITQQLEGLQAGTSYDVRLVATKPFGSGSTSSTVTFNTAAAAPEPIVEPSVYVNGTSATFGGFINPNNSPTSYHFEYVNQAAFQESGFADATSVPSSDASAGSAAATKPTCTAAEEASGCVPLFVASQQISGLSPGTTYHLRLVATSGAGSAASLATTFSVEANGGCANEALRKEQVSETLPAGTIGMPACMALEMASPPAKENQPVKDGGNQANNSVSVDGNHVFFRANVALGETKAVLNISQGDVYVASRGANGWTTHATILRPTSGANSISEPRGMSPDFGSWFQIVPETENRAAELKYQAFRSQLGVGSKAFSSLLLNSEQQEISSYAGSSADASHLYIKVGNNGNASPQRLLPSDPKPAPAATARPNVYILTLGEDGQPAPLQLLTRDRFGKAWGGNCGARVGGDIVSLAQGATAQRARVQGAISENGARVYFSTRATQPEVGNCEPAVNKMRILERAETPSGPVITNLVQAECSRVSPACDATDGDDNFQGASANGSRVYFTSTRQLVNSDLDSGASCGTTLGAATGCDLYLYEKLSGGGHTLVQVSAGDATDPTPGSGAKVLENIAGISTDGSHVYFAAEGVLTTKPNEFGAVPTAGQPNFYLYERDGAYPSGRTVFVGTLASTDAGELWGSGKVEAFGGSSVYPVPAMDSSGEKIGADGHVLLFRSKAQLSPNDTDGSRRDVYRYDSQNGALQCISCLPGGDSGAGEANAGQPEGLQEGKAQGPAFASLGRWVSEDGNSVVFQTVAPLLPEDTNTTGDEYLWREGRLTLLPKADPSGNPTISGDGSVVGFRTAKPLLPQDGDSVEDMYVLRAGGGFPIPPAKKICVAEDCQEPFHGQPSPATAGSETAAGGNVVEPSPAKCKKGFVRRKGRCVKRHHRKKHHHHRKNRAAGNRQGGSK